MLNKIMYIIWTITFMFFLSQHLQFHAIYAAIFAMGFRICDEIREH